MTKKEDKIFKDKVKQAIEKKIRPSIQMDGGDIELIDADNQLKTVTVQLSGACVGCPLAPLTLRFGVERELKNIFPELKELKVID